MCLCVLMGAPAAWALDPSLDASKYGHTLWRNLDGFSPGTIGPIAQTTDGYLWLGTPTGLLRFDGARSVRWRPPPGVDLPDERVRALFGSRDGTLWIGTPRGVASWKDGKLTVHPSMNGRTVNAFEEDGEGMVWVGGSFKDRAFLCTANHAPGECRGADGSLGSVILALHRDDSGSMWAAGKDHVWRWKPEPFLSFPLSSPVGALRTMTGIQGGGVVVGARGQIATVSNGSVGTMRLPEWAKGLVFTKALRDRDGGLWVAASDFGLLHFHGDDVDTFTSVEGLSGDHVLGLFEDREGNVWVSTSHGLDRFRPMAAAVYSRRDGIKGRAASVLAARDGSIWTSTSTGVYRLSNGHVSHVRPSRSATLFEDRQARVWIASQYEFGYMDAGQFVSVPGVPKGTIDGIAEDSKGSVWIAHRDAGLLRLGSSGVVERISSAALGNPGRVSTMTIDPTDDSLWLGLWSGNVLSVADGKVRDFYRLREPGRSRGVVQIRVEADGAAWITTRTGLTRIHQGRMHRFDSDSGLPCDGANWTLVHERTLSLYTPCGLLELDRAEVDAWSAAVDKGEKARVNVRRLLDHWDGVGQPANVSAVGQIESVQLFTPKAARSDDGRVWLVTGDGVAAVNPARIPFNGIPPPVRIEQVASDGIPYEPRSDLQLPPLQRNLEITYTGLSLSVPERVQFRYKLEGRDADWQDAGNRRQAFYTDLSPGRYRFRVMAANDSGVWNREGATFDFSIAPAWWQTGAFRAACAAAVLLVLAGLYWLRIERLSRRLSMSFEARVNERLRIARELHDTLLQTFQGLVLRLQTAHQLMPDSDGRRILEEGIDQAAEAITEGRDAVQGLRATATETSDLADAVRALGQVLAADPASPSARLGVEVHGRPRSLHPIVRDDAFRIVGEALRNAFRHADPTRVEVEIRYDDRQLSIRVRDDGKGMDPGVVRRGREGHFGLHGMRERAKLIGGALTFWSRLDAGTAVELTVPASRAYANESNGARPDRRGAPNDYPADTTIYP